MSPTRLAPHLRGFAHTLAGIALVGAAAAHAQRSDAEIQDDIAFAKGLAKDWGFVELATEVIARIERAGVPTTQRERLGLTKCEIYEVAAVNERDRARRNDLFAAALRAYEDFIAQNRLSTALPEAEMGYVRISGLYSRSMEIALESLVGEQAEALRKTRVEVLERAVAKSGDLVSQLKLVNPKTERQRADLAELMLNRGSMLLDMGRIQESGQFSYEQAIRVLEEVVFDFGEGTPPALRAYDLIGRVYAARQQWDMARDFFEAVVEQAIPSDPAEWRQMIADLQLGPADKERRWLFVELSTEGLVQAYQAIGNLAKGSRYALHLYNTQKREGFAYSLQLGYPSLLAAARMLLDSGGWVGGDPNSGDLRWFATEEEVRKEVTNRRNRFSTTDFALRIADQVNKENRGNVLQVRAQKLIAEIIEQPGVDVDPSFLYEAAEGQYNDRNDEAALAGFKRVLRALEGKESAVRLQYGAKIYFRMGRIYQRLERPLEAALAFQEGCTTWVGDPEHDSPNAQNFYQAMQEVSRRSAGDQAITALLGEAERLAASLSTQDKDQITFNFGMRSFRAGDFAEAIQHFGQVQPTGVDYEKALVHIAVAKLRMGQTAEAERLLEEYIEEYVKDPTKATGNSPTKEARRREALAMAEFYRGSIAFRRAEKAAEDGKDDPALWRRFLELCDGYEDRFPEQTSYASVLMRSAMNAKLALGDTAEARKEYDKLFQTYPESPSTSPAAVNLYNALRGRLEQARTADEVDRAQQLLREMALLLEFGNKANPSPSFQNLRTESQHWMELADWAKAESVLARIAERFGRDAEQKESMTRQVLPDLAHAMLEQQKVAQAFALLTPLVTDETSKPTKRTVLDYCRAVTGWVGGAPREIKIVPGAGTTVEEFERATQVLNNIALALPEKWACEWYAYQFQLAYAFYVRATADWSPDKDSKQRETAKKILSTLVVELGPDFRGKGVDGVDTACMAAGPELARDYGGDVLRSRLAWLWGKLQ